MAYSKDEIKRITDKVLNMCKADAVEVRFSGGERSATRYANSSITANLIEHDQEAQITVRFGQKSATLLNTGMTRDGLFLIENGKIVGPVQNFRWNESPAVSFNNITMLGKPVPMHTGEAYDNPGTALVPPMMLEDFTMTSISPAV
jgi:predicted Zn-dependent protease